MVAVYPFELEIEISHLNSAPREARSGTPYPENRLRSLGFRRALNIGLPAILALIVLNIGFAHQNLWPTLWIRPTAELSLELIVLVTALGGLAAAGVRLGSKMRWAVASLLLVYIFARYADVTAPALFGRRVDLFWDTQHLPAVAGMVLESWPILSIAALVAGALLAITLLLLALRTAVAAMCRALDLPPMRNAALGAGALLLGTYAAGISSQALSWERNFALPVTPVYFAQAQVIAARLTGTLETPELKPTLPPVGKLNGADVFVIFLESYGRIALDNPAYADATRSDLSELQTALASKGWSTRSAFLTPPTFGGASWLSHTSFLSGNTLDSHDLYQAFLHSPIEKLTDRFRAAGYRSLLLTPGIRGPWPAGLPLGFDDIAPAKALQYEGPAFGWWQIPDQYSLEWLYRTEIARSGRQPLFIMFPTIMSHFPFGPTPPYVADWPALNSPEPFDRAAVEAALVLGDAVSGDAQAAYARVVAYDLETVAGFVMERAPDHAIIIALGDHQPPAAISGQDAVRDIPIHVFARDENLLIPFSRAGFFDGMLPHGASVARIDEIPGMLLEALAAPVPASRVAGVD